MDSLTLALGIFGIGSAIVFFALSYPKTSTSLIKQGKMDQRIEMEKNLLKRAKFHIEVFSRKGEWLTRSQGIPFLKATLDRKVDVTIAFSNHDIGNEIIEVAKEYSSENKCKGVLKLYNVPEEKIEGKEEHFWVVDSKIWLKEDEHDIEANLNKRHFEYSFKTPEIALSLDNLFNNLKGNAIKGT